MNEQKKTILAACTSCLERIEGLPRRPRTGPRGRLRCSGFFVSAVAFHFDGPNFGLYGNGVLDGNGRLGDNHLGNHFVESRSYWDEPNSDVCGKMDSTSSGYFGCLWNCLPKGISKRVVLECRSSREGTAQTPHRPSRQLRPCTLSTKIVNILSTWSKVKWLLNGSPSSKLTANFMLILTLFVVQQKRPK